LARSWRDELAEAAVGWLGGTFGFTDDERFLGLVRFESRAATTASSDRTEQGRWAERMAGLLDGTPEFHDCDDVTTFLAGGSDEAGFVQVIRGHLDDAAPAKAMLADTGELQSMRPEIIGGTLAVAEDGTYFWTIYFTDEESARRGEGLEPPTEVREAVAAMMSGATFHDLRDPWFESC
jgi:hypothetical protein